MSKTGSPPVDDDGRLSKSILYITITVRRSSGSWARSMVYRICRKPRSMDLETVSDVYGIFALEILLS